MQSPANSLFTTQNYRIVPTGKTAFYQNLAGLYIWSSRSANTLLYLLLEVILWPGLNFESDRQDDNADVYKWILWVLKMKKLLTKEQIAQTLDELLTKILPDIPQDGNFAVIGIRSRGEVLAKRLCKAIEAKTGRTVLSGTLDITLYRDDFNAPKGHNQPKVQATEIEFDVSDKFILLVDDVLHTGRSVRAAMDALTDLGRPKTIRLAVLIDRGHQELPIRADYVGIRTEAPAEQSIKVFLMESDGIEEVVIN